MDHEALLSTIYAASAGDGDWADVPRALCDSFDGAAALLSDGYASNPRSFQTVAENYGDDFLAGSGFTAADNFNSESNWSYQQIVRRPSIRSFGGNAVTEGGNDRQRAFYHASFLRNGIETARAFGLFRQGDAVAGGFVARSFQRGPFEPDEVSRLDATLGHLRRAIDMRMRLSIGRAAQETMNGILAHASFAVFLLDRDERIVLRNSAGDGLLNAAEGVREARGYLHLTDPGADALFRKRLRRLYEPGFVPTEMPLQIPRRGDNTPLSVSVFRATGIGPATGIFGAFASVVITDPCEQGDLPSARQVQLAFGLTPAEASVARLTPLALSRRQIAKRLGVAESTVKSHLASVRAKLGARSTAVLSIMVSRLGRP